MFLSIFDPLTNLLSKAMWSLCQALFYLIFWIEEVFNILAGLHQIPASKIDTSDLVTGFLKTNGLAQIFMVMLGIGLVVFLLCIVWGFIKAIWNKNPSEAGKKVLANSFKALIYLVFIPVFVFAGLWIFSNLLKIIANTFSFQINGSTISDGSTIDQWTAYQQSSIAQSIFIRLFRGAFISSDIIFTKSYDELNAIIDMDFTSGDFQYIVAIIVTCAMLFSLALAAVALCERIINIALLYLIAPVVVSTSPLDDGKRMEAWRDLMLSKIIGILGNIMSMNIFLMLLAFVSEGIAYDSFGKDEWQQQMVVNVLYFVIAITGSFVCFKGSQLIASTISQAAGTSEGFSQMTTTGLARGAMHTVGAGLGKAKSLFGGKNNAISQANQRQLNSAGGGAGGGGSGGEAGAGGAGGIGMTTGQQMLNATKGHGKVAANSIGKTGVAAAGIGIGATALGAGAIAGGLMGIALPVMAVGAGIMAGKTIARHAKGYAGIGLGGIKTHKERKNAAKEQLTKEGGLSSDKKTAKAQIKQRMKENNTMSKLQNEAKQGNVNSQIELQKMNDSRMEQQQNRLDQALKDSGIVKDRSEITDSMRMTYGNNEMKQWLTEKNQNNQIGQQNNSGMKMPSAEASTPKQDNKQNEVEQEQPKQPTNTEGGAM